MFPSTSFTLYLLEARIPCATLTLPPLPALPEQPEQPARTVHIILPLYNALAYPNAYYAPGTTLTPIPDLRPLIAQPQP